MVRPGLVRLRECGGLKVPAPIGLGKGQLRCGMNSHSRRRSVLSDSFYARSSVEALIRDRY